MNFDAIKERWQNINTNRKILFVTLGVSFFIIIFLLGTWLTKEEFSPLMTNLDTKDAGAIVTKLQDLNVPYQLGAEGKSILVPKEQVYDVRLKLASEGIFEGGGLGFELFDETKLGVTDFERRLNYQRALQEELRRTIIQLEEVENARVHIVLPEKSVFVEDEKAASASIALKLKPLGNLKPEQVKGIVHLVSSSVEGLPPESVNIIDMNGNILSQDVLTEGPNYETTTMFAQKKEFEKEIEQRVQTMLEKILGPGKAVAMVSAELDFSQQQTTEITYGKEGFIRSQQIIEDIEKNTGGEGVPAGTGANTDPNPDTYPAVNPGESESSHKDETTNYELDQKEVTTVKAPGTLNRLSTAVTVDGVLDDNLVREIEGMVAAATGFSGDRGDQIFVSSMGFDTSYTEKMEAEMQQAAQAEAEALKREAYIKWGLISAAALALLILAIIVIRLIARSFVGSNLDQTIDEPIAIKDIDTEPAIVDEVWENQKEIKSFAEKEPDEVANLLKVWLAEDRG